MICSVESKPVSEERAFQAEVTSDAVLVWLSQVQKEGQCVARADERKKIGSQAGSRGLDCLGSCNSFKQIEITVSKMKNH
jgi:hypothetical protein